MTPQITDMIMAHEAYLFMAMLPLLLSLWIIKRWIYD